MSAIAKFCINSTAYGYKMKELNFRNVHPRNMKTYATSDVRSSSDHVGGMRNVGINGNSSEPMIQPPTRIPNLEE
jgi:hypothetical protein